MTGTTPEDPAHSLRLALIEAQYALRATAHAPRGRGVVVLVSGVELAGKGEAVTQLREWMDPRLLQVSAHLPRHQDWRLPLWLPYVRDLPELGQLVVLFGNWYGDLLAARMAGKTLGLSRAEFERQVVMLREFEQDLRAEGFTVVKCWFDLPWAQLQTRLDRVDPALQQWQQLHGLDWRNQAQYDELQRLRQALGEDWINIDCCDPEQRDLDFGHVVLDALKAAACCTRIGQTQLAECCHSSKLGGA
jgi:polyphosphate kinase 2 (PPK2 family)